MKNEINNIPASIKALLLNKAKELNRPFSEILQNYAMERFLYRLSISSYSGNFILKGALLFLALNIKERRTTKDIDFLSNNTKEEMFKIIKEICRIKYIPDGIIFDANSIEQKNTRETAEYEGVRIKLFAYIGKTKISIQIDIGFGDSVYPRAKNIEIPAILNQPKPVLKGYSVESVVSEKFQIMIKLGQLNSRMKDFYDIWIIMDRFEINGTDLYKALKRTFRRRKTVLPIKKPFFAEEIYEVKSENQLLWMAFLKKNDIHWVPKSLRDVAVDIENHIYRAIREQKNDI